MVACWYNYPDMIAHCLEFFNISRLSIAIKRKHVDIARKLIEKHSGNIPGFVLNCAGKYAGADILKLLSPITLFSAIKNPDAMKYTVESSRSQPSQPSKLYHAYGYHQFWKY